MSFIETRCLQLTYMSGLYKMHIFIKLFDTCLIEILYMYVIITHNNTKCNKETTCLLFSFSLAGHGTLTSHMLGKHSPT